MSSLPLLPFQCHMCSPPAVVCTLLGILLSIVPFPSLARDGTIMGGRWEGAPEMWYELGLKNLSCGASHIYEGEREGGKEGGHFDSFHLTTRFREKKERRIG